VEPDSAGLPVLTFTDDCAPVDHAFDVFRDTTAPLFDTGLLEGAGGFQSTATDYLVDDVMVSRVSTSAHTLRRTTAHLRDGTTDWITVQLYERGGVLGEAGRDVSLDLDPDRIGIVDLSEPFTAWNRGGVAIWIALPRARVHRADHLAPVQTLDRRSLRGRVLHAAAFGLWRRLGDARAGDASVLASEIAETVNTVLDPAEFTPTDRDLATAMVDYVKVNLGDLDLGVDQLRRAFHCSRSSVYRSFERRGGVANYIREQRLLRCFEQLTRPTTLPRRVSDVATRWGFENPSHFNRLFKAKFGLPPSALRGRVGSARSPQSIPSETAGMIRDFRGWAMSSSRRTAPRRLAESGTDVQPGVGRPGVR
jgi:AraC-like DNA-binding protein